MITLGIDCGTQSTRTLAMDAETGEVLAAASQSYGLIEGLPDGHQEQHPRTWTDAAERTLTQVLGELGDRKGAVAAIGVSGQQHGFVALDADGAVIRPAKLWCDTSTAPQCDQMRAHFGGRDALVALAGNDLSPGFTAPKILWLKQEEPENYARLAHVLLPHDYLNYWLTGAMTMEYGDASGTALMDIRQREWCEPLCRFIDPGLLEKLPALQSSQEKAGNLKPELAGKWGLGEHVVVSAGGGDNMMGAIGTGNTEPGRVTASLGTSGTIFAYAADPVTDPYGEIAGFCDSTDAWLPLLCTMNVTVATEALRHAFGLSLEAFNEQVAAVPPGADGLLLLPYLTGERVPNLPGATGVLHGMTPRNLTPGHLCRAAMEGVTLGMAYGLRRLERLGVETGEIRLIGGGSKSAVWRQLCADVFGCPVVPLASSEGAALGAAIQALAAVNPGLATGEIAGRLVKVAENQRCEPREDGFDYGALLEKQTTLSRHLAEGGYL
ncbi:MAG: xylulokinase [Verrucomicrobiota bacterium]